MTADLLSLIPAVAAWLAVLYKLPALRRRSEDAAIRAFWLSLLFLALALTVLIPSVAVDVDAISHVANVSRLLGNGLVLVASWQVQVFLFYLNYRAPEARPRAAQAGWALLTALILMSVLFGLAPVHQESINFWQRYGRAPFILEYRIVFLAYLGLALFNVVRLGDRYGRAADRPALALGLRMVAIGGVLGLIYVAHESARILALAFAWHNAFLESDTVTRVLIASSIVLMVVGATIPAWGNRAGIPQLYRWVARYRSCRRLYPLWRDVCQALPEIALLRPSSSIADILTIRDLEFRLYRRVVEIRDGQLALRSYVEPWIAEYARDLCHEKELPAETTERITEAAVLAAALHAQRLGHLGHTPHVSTSPIGGSNIRTEVAALERVAYYYRQSRVVRAVLRRMRREESAAGTGRLFPRR